MLKTKEMPKTTAFRCELIDINNDNDYGCL